MASRSEDQWVLAQKWRHEVVKETDRLKEDGSDGTEVTRFETIEAHLAQYRLACIQAILGDIKFAAEKKMELDLWQTHLLINTVYRKILHRLSSTQQRVARRKVDNLYQHFLKVAQDFYRGYLQRICARYGIKELTGALHRLKLTPMELPKESQVDITAMGVKEEALGSCHQTLICLGDLARYRTFQRSAEKRNWAGALTAYDLAINLIPESGFGHHQTGLIYLETRDFFKAVYHMYRAMGCDRPHELAAGNLNRVFREVLKLDGSADKKSWTETTTMTNWFVKLHARFSKGEERKSYDEMEEEVLHRFGRSLKVEGDDTVHDALIKMVVTNIAAYYAIMKKTAGQWSEAGSRSCEHLLRWNIRTISPIARFLRSELVEYLKAVADHPGRESATSRLPPAISFGMALLSIYMTWLCTYSSDLVDFQAHLEPHFGDMGKDLAQTLTLVLELVYRVLGPANHDSTPFRLEEDDETLGLKCLDGSTLPERCRLQRDPLTGVIKVARGSNDSGYTDEQIVITRAAHISCCAVQLGSDLKFPFLYTTCMQDSKPESTVVFLEEGKPLLPPPGGDLTSPVAAIPNLPLPKQNMGNPAAAREPPTSEQPMDDQVFSMVNEFLIPPESPRAAAAPQDQSPVSQNIPMPTPRRVSSTAPAQYPNLPWNFFYNPTPLVPLGGHQKATHDHGPGGLSGNQGPPQRQHATPVQGTTLPTPFGTHNSQHSPYSPHSPYQSSDRGSELPTYFHQSSDSFQHQQHKITLSDASPQGQFRHNIGGEDPFDELRVLQTRRPLSQEGGYRLRAISGMHRTGESDSLNAPATRADGGKLSAPGFELPNIEKGHRTQDLHHSQTFGILPYFECAPTPRREELRNQQRSPYASQPPEHATSDMGNSVAWMGSPIVLQELHEPTVQDCGSKLDEQLMNRLSLSSPRDAPNLLSSLDSEKRRQFLINALRRNMSEYEAADQAGVSSRSGDIEEAHQSRKPPQPEFSAWR